MRDRADRAATPRRAIGAGELASYGLIIGAVLLGWQIAIQPLIQREQGGALAGQHDVRGAVHHRPCGDDRIAEALQGGDRPGLARRAVHQAGVQLISPGQIGRGPAAGDIEAGILQQHCGLDRNVERSRFS